MLADEPDTVIPLSRSDPVHKLFTRLTLTKNGKFFKYAQRNILYIDRSYFGPAWTFLTPFYQLLEWLVRPGCNDQHIAILKVADLAGDPEFRCFFFRTLSIENSLDLAGDSNRD